MFGVCVCLKMLLYCGCFDRYGCFIVCGYVSVVFVLFGYV